MHDQAAGTGALRWAMGLVAAPVVPAALMVKVLDDTPSPMAVFAFMAVMGYVAMLVFGLPVLLVWRTWFVAGAKTCIAVGVWAGAAMLMACAGLLKLLAHESFLKTVLMPELAATAIGGGAVAGFVLWAIARPDRGARVLAAAAQSE